MYKKALLLLSMVTATSTDFVNSQGLANQGFENFSCNAQTAGRQFYRLDECGLQPWRVSHGSPDIEGAFSQIPGTFYATVAGGGAPDWRRDGRDWGSEGIFQNYNFYRGNRYYLRAYVRAFNINIPNDLYVDKVFMALTSGLAARTNNPNAPAGQRDASYSFPSVSKIQEVWNEQQYRTSGWVLVDKEFIPNSDYSQFWISLIDDDDGGFINSAANMDFTLVNVSCCPYDVTIGSSSDLTAVPTATHTLETSGNVTIGSGKNVSFKAEEEIVLKPGFTSLNGSSFVAAIDNCDCSLGGDNVVSICDQFNGNISFITSSSGTGVYVPNVFVRNGSNYWYPTSYGYSKPYNAYHWKLEVFNRWGTKVDELEETTGVEGFANQSIKWNAAGLSTGLYNILLKVTNCSGTYTYNNQVQIFDSNGKTTASESRLKSSGEYTDEDLVITASSLQYASPNPSLGNTTINYSVSTIGHVTLELLNSMGVRIRSIVDNYTHQAGVFKVDIDTHDLPSGVYLYKFQTSDCTEVEQLIVN